MKRKRKAKQADIESAATEERPALAILEDIKAGRLSGKDLEIPTRQQCVAYLMFEGYSIAEIARIMGINERMVSRDKRDIRQAHAVEAGPEWVAEMIGALRLGAEASIARFRQISRNKDAPIRGRLEAERLAWTVLREFAELMQRLGHLPTAPQEFRGAFLHQVSEVPPLSDTKAELERLITILKEGYADDPERLGHLMHLRQEIAHREVGEQIQMITEHIEREGDYGLSPN